MNNRCNLRLTILLGATVVWSSINGLARAEESATVPTNPGFNGYTGQINPGSTHPVTSQSKEVTNIPTPEESRQALLEPYSKQPSLGNSPSVPRPEPETFGGPNANQQSQNAVGVHEALRLPAALRIQVLQRLADRRRRRLLRQTNPHRPDRSVRLVRRFLPNFPSETIFSTARLLWVGRCHSPISNVRK